MQAWPTISCANLQMYMYMYIACIVLVPDHADDIHLDFGARGSAICSTISHRSQCSLAGCPDARFRSASTFHGYNLTAPKTEVRSSCITTAIHQPFESHDRATLVTINSLLSMVAHIFVCSVAPSQLVSVFRVYAGSWTIISAVFFTTHGLSHRLQAQALGSRRTETVPQNNT